jgi:flagellin-like protein
MKGVSAVIATILMLMITIALAGTAYLYITGFFGSKTGVVLALDPSSRCTSSAFTVVLKNDGTSIASNIQIDITLPNSNILPADCSVLFIAAGGANSTTCPIIGGTNGNYGVRAYGGGATATGIIYCGSQPGNPTSGTTTTTSTSTTTTTLISGTTTTTSTSATSTTTTTTTTPSGTPDVIGGTTFSDYNGFGYILWQQVTVVQPTGSLRTVGVNIFSPGSNVRTAIYSDNSNAPGTLLAASGSVAQTVGWNDLSVTGVTITQGAKYWLAVQTSSSIAYFACQSCGTRYYLAYTYGSFPANANGASHDTYAIINMRIFH